MSILLVPFLIPLVLSPFFLYCAWILKNAPPSRQKTVDQILSVVKLALAATVSLVLLVISAEYGLAVQFGGFVKWLHLAVINSRL